MEYAKKRTITISSKEKARLIIALEIEWIWKSKNPDIRRFEYLENLYNDAGGWYEKVVDFLARMRRALGTKEVLKYRRKFYRQKKESPRVFY